MASGLQSTVQGIPCGPDDSSESNKQTQFRFPKGSLLWFPYDKRKEKDNCLAASGVKQPKNSINSNSNSNNHNTNNNSSSTTTTNNNNNSNNSNSNISP